jgi:hypothetical protein
MSRVSTSADASTSLIWLPAIEENEQLVCGPSASPVRFCVVLVCFILLSNIWTILLYLNVPWKHFPRYFCHQLTFSIVHGTLFSVAAAVLGTTLDRNFAHWLSPFQKALVAIVALVFWILATFAVIDDATKNSIDPYMLTGVSVSKNDATQESVYDYDEMLHREFGKLKPPTTKKEDKGEEWVKYEKALENYRSLLPPFKEAIIPYKDRDTAKRQQVNSVYFANAVLTWIFVIMIVGIYVPALLALALFRYNLHKLAREIKSKAPPGTSSITAVQKQQLQRTIDCGKTYYRLLWANFLVFFLLVVAWFPFRVAASYYNHGILLEPGYSWITEYQAFGSLLLLAVVFLIVLILLRWGKSILVRLAAIVLVAATVTAAIGWFSPEVRTFFYELIDNNLSEKKPVFFIINYLALFILALALAWFSADEDPDPEARIPAADDKAT